MTDKKYGLFGMTVFNGDTLFQLYLRLLGRPIDKVGQIIWALEVCVGGKTIKDVEREIKKSQEYKLLHPIERG